MRQANASDPNVGSAKSTSSSILVLVTTIVPSICIALLAFSFVFLTRKQLPSVYAAKGREHYPRDANCARVASPVAWITELYHARDIDLLCSQNIDGYLLVRYLKLCILLCLGGCVILCPLLLPLNATGAGGMSQLDALTIANVKNGSWRTYAHSCCTILFFAWVMFVIKREEIFCLDLKHEHRALKRRIGHPDSRTVLFTNVVREVENLDIVNHVFGDMRGLQVWFATDLRSLTKTLRQRTSLVDKIDTVLTKLTREHFDVLGNAFQKTTWGSETRVCRPVLPPVSLEHPMEAVKQYAARIKDLEVDEKQKLHEYRCRGARAIKGLAGNAVEPHSPRLLSSAVVRFRSVEDAEIAYRSRFHKDLTRFVPQCIDISTKDLCWESLRFGWWQSLTRRTLSQAMILGMIIFWSVPVAVVTALTNVENIVPDSLWSEKIPPLVRNALSGLLPSLVLSMLMALAPRIIARLARFSGILTLGKVELYVQNYYFCFRVVQVFLVAALGSTATSVLAQIYTDPSSATAVLARKLPGASNFYLSYFVVQGFTEAALIVLNVDGLLSRYVLSSIFDDTSRKRVRRRKECLRISSGTAIATSSNLLIIALSYAPIAPLVLFFAAIAFAMFYLSYRHNLLLVADVAAETSGGIYSRALQHAMVGIYIGELYLIGLFAIASVDERGLRGQLIMACALLAGTLVFQKLSNHSVKQWRDSLPWNGPSSHHGLAEVGAKQSPVSLHSKVCAVFLDDLNAICKVLRASGDMSRGGQHDEYEFLAPVVVEREADILLGREITDFVQTMLGPESCRTFTLSARSLY